MKSQPRVGFVKPSGETDSARNAIDLGDGEAIFGKNQVRPNDAGNVARESAFTLEGHEFLWFARIEQIGNPRRLTAFDALAVKLVAGPQEKHEAVAELLEFRCESIRQRKGCR